MEQFGRNSRKFFLEKYSQKIPARFLEGIAKEIFEFLNELLKISMYGFQLNPSIFFFEEPLKDFFKNYEIISEKKHGIISVAVHTRFSEIILEECSRFLEATS